MSTALPAKGNILGWMILPLKRYAQFDGRSGRREFWWFSAYLTLSYTVIVAVWIGFLAFNEASFGETGLNDSDSIGLIVFVVLWGLVFIGNFLPGLALTSRRFHDLGLPGWLVVVTLLAVFMLSIIGWIGYMIVMSLPPQKGENQYGPPVYGDEIADVFT